MGRVDMPLPQLRPLGGTSRTDAWWVRSVVVGSLLLAFIVYATWAAFQGKNYHVAEGGAQYLSPFYSPELWGDSPHALLGKKPGWLPWPGFLAFSPAMLILWAPGGFRFTCYYYRGAYYKALWADPPGCAVGEPGFRQKSYRGEQKFPLILQNIHRYFLYAAVAFIGLLAYDAWKAMWFENPATGQTEFGIGVGTIILTVNVILLGSYTFGCHAFRHLVGGFKDEVSKSPMCDTAYACSTALNYKHQLFAWCSLFSVMFSDVYIRLCSMGIWSDLRLL